MFRFGSGSAFALLTSVVIGEVQPFDPRPSVSAASEALASQGVDFALIGGLALDAWGIRRATKDADFAVPVGAGEKAADALRGPTTEVRPLRIGGAGVRDTEPTRERS